MFLQLKIRKSSLLFLTSVAMMFNHGSANAKSKKSVAEQFITWDYKETPMGLYLPEKTDKPLPVVMFLHGCNNNPVNSYLWIIAALNAIEPCAVFLPTAPPTLNTPYSCADWGGTYDGNLRPQMINALHELDSLITCYGFDTQRQYLYGESMGGEGVYRLLMDFPKRFAGAVGASGYSINKGAAQMAQTPLWILIGSNDEMSPIDSSRVIYNSILSAGGTMVKYTEYPDLGHVAAIELTRTKPEVLKWLLTQKRSTGIIQKSRSGNGILSPNLQLSYTSGNLCFSSWLPAETMVTLFDLNGQIIFRADHQTKSLRLPAGTANSIVLWNASNSQFCVSGKTSLLRR